MGTKLLEKKQVVALKTQERAKEQAEGLKLARRVDSLREIQAQEEASLKLFREKTLTQIKADIEKESAPLEALRKEVQELQQARVVALKPLDVEKKAIEKQRTEMYREHEVLNLWREETKKKESIASAALKEAEDEYQRANEYKKRHEQFLKDADLKHLRAQEALSKAEKIKQDSVVLAQKMEQELAARDTQMAANERRIELRDKAQDERERELNARETRLHDREQMLERTIKRNK